MEADYKYEIYEVTFFLFTLFTGQELPHPLVIPFHLNNFFPPKSQASKTPLGPCLGVNNKDYDCC